MIRRTTTKVYSRAFSLVEMLIAVAISAAILSAMMVALDTTFKGFETNADSASSHVVTRIAVNRLLTMVRTGTEFGPVSADVLDSEINPLVADYFEFVSARNADGSPRTISRVEYRYPGAGALHRSWGIGQQPPPLGFTPSGPGELHLVQIDVETNNESSFMLLREVRSVRFILKYDIGPRLERTTIDITVDPRTDDETHLATDASAQSVRIVASAMPRQLVMN